VLCFYGYKIHSRNIFLYQVVLVLFGCVFPAEKEFCEKNLNLFENNDYVLAGFSKDCFSVRAPSK